MKVPLDLSPYNEYDLAVSIIHNVLDKVAAPGWEFSWTRRQHYGLVRVNDGTARFEASDWQHEAIPDDILYLEQEDTYRVTAGPTGCRLTVANFGIDGAGRNTPFPLQRLLRATRVSMYETLFHELLTAWTGKGVAHKLESRGILGAIIFNLVYDSLQERIHAHGISQIQPALKHIERFYNTDVRVAELARRVGVTQPHFRRLFKDATGHSPKDYILSLRILRAKDYVKSELHSLSEIAEHLGFSSVSHFSRAFKNRTGQSPMEYRRDG